MYKFFIRLNIISLTLIIVGALFIILPQAGSFSASVVARQVHMQCTLTYEGYRRTFGKIRGSRQLGKISSLM